MRCVGRFPASTVAVSLTLLSGGSMVSKSYAEGDHYGVQKPAGQGKNAKKGKYGWARQRLGIW